MLNEFVMDIFAKVIYLIIISLFAGYLWVVVMLAEVGTCEAYGLIAILSIIVGAFILMHFLKYITC